MLDNLTGKYNSAGSDSSDEEGDESDGEAVLTVSAFKTEDGLKAKKGNNAFSSKYESDDEASDELQITHPQGIKVRKAMIKASNDIASLLNAKPVKPAAAAGVKGKKVVGKVKEEAKGLDPKDKKWDGIYKDASEKMGIKDVAPSKFGSPALDDLNRQLMYFDASSSLYS